MQFALLGTDEDTLTVVREMLNSTEYSLDVMSASREDVARVRQISPVRTLDSWEAILSRQDLDAIIVASGDAPEWADERLKKLAQAGSRLLVVHPACDVMVAYELDVICSECKSVIVPFGADWLHPAWNRIDQWVHQEKGSSSGLPHLERIVFERSMADHSRESVWRQFSRDVLPIRRWLGEITSVNAAGVALEDSSFANLSIHFTGQGGLTARWSVAPPGSEAVSRVTLVGKSGTATLHIPAGVSTWRFEGRGEVEFSESFPPWNSGRDALERMSAAIRGEPTSPSWQDVCLDLEIVDHVKTSLRRKRNIDLHLGERSEERTFKAFMSAAGCLILTTILVGFFFLAVFEGFRLPMRDTTNLPPADQPPESTWPLWLRLLPVYPLLAFLLLQLLVHFARRPKNETVTNSFPQKRGLDPSSCAHEPKGPQ